MAPAQTLSRAERRKLRFGPGGTVRYRDKDGNLQVTSADRIRAYQADKLGDFAADGIFVFFANDYRVVAAAKLARRPRFPNDHGLASQQAIEGIPVIHAKSLLFGKWIPDPSELRPDSRVVISRKANRLEDCITNPS